MKRNSKKEQGKTSPKKALSLLLGFFMAVVGIANAQSSIEFWDMVWGPPEYVDTAKALVDQFNAEQSEFKVNYTSVPWANWYQTYVTAIGSGTAPCMSTGAGYQAAQLSDFGAIRPLDDLIDDLTASGDINDFAAGTIEALKYEGHYIALPWQFDIRTLYYRTDRLAEAGLEPPTTWEEFINVAAALNKDGKYGFVLSGGGNGAVHTALTFMINNGGGLFDEAGNLDLRHERTLETLQFYADLVAAGGVHPASAGYSDDEARAAFGQGNAAFILGGPGELARFPEQAQNMAILPPLKGPHGDTGTLLWVNNIMMYNQCNDAEAAKTFMKWWSKNQAPLWSEGHTSSIPVRQSIADIDYVKNNDIVNYILANYIPIGKTTAANVGGVFPALNEIEGDGTLQTLIQEILQGKDLNAAIDNANQKLQSTVKQ